MAKILASLVLWAAPAQAHDPTGSWVDLNGNKATLHECVIDEFWLPPTLDAAAAAAKMAMASDWPVNSSHTAMASV